MIFSCGINCTLMLMILCLSSLQNEILALDGEFYFEYSGFVQHRVHLQIDMFNLYSTCKKGINLHYLTNFSQKLVVTKCNPIEKANIFLNMHWCVNFSSQNSRVLLSNMLNKVRFYNFRSLWNKETSLSEHMVFY